MSSLAPSAGADLARTFPATPKAWASSAPGTLLVFAAVLGPMMTVPALRKLIVDAHHGSPLMLHAFVAVGMLGSVLGAPLLGRLADARGRPLSLATRLAVLDALVTLLSSAPLPTALLFALRPLHGAASVGLLSLLFASFRGSRRALVSRAGGAAIAALALGPALGGGLSHLGAGAPFLASGGSTLALALVLWRKSRSQARFDAPDARPEARGSLADTARTLASPLVLVATQRFAFGGLVAAFALHARRSFGFSDAKVGMCFSCLLVVFALGTYALGKSRSIARLASLVAPGALVFGASLALLSCAPGRLIVPLLALCGASAALVYAPCLAIVAAHSAKAARATSLSLLHAAGALGMLLGPLGGVACELLLRGEAAELRGRAFLIAAGALSALVACALSPKVSQSARRAAA